MTSPEPANPIILQNQHLSVEFDSSSGAICQITHPGRGLNLVEAASDAPPWRIEIDDQQWIDTFTTFDFDATVTTIDLRWTATNGLLVRAIVTLEPDADEADFRIEISGLENVIDKIEYPIIGGIGSLRDGADSYLAHPQGTGFLFRNPATLFTAEKPGIRYSPYPEGFSGSSLQCFTYFAEHIGGFSFSTYDASGAMKWLNLWKHENGHLRTSFMHQSPDVRTGNGYTPSYAVTVAALDQGTWYEAADRYKSWAIRQPWAARGPIAENPNSLHSDIGYATFGINSSHDRAAWLDNFHKAIGSRALHILGVNWPRQGGNYGGVHPGGRDDWFPAQFNQANLDTIRGNGDAWAPFEFDLIQDVNGSESESVKASLVEFQDEKYSFDAYHFAFHCPVTQYQQELHSWRDERLAREFDVDGIYYDISANNVLMQCRNPNHGHPVGGGAWMVDAYREMWQATGAAATASKGRPVLQGAEMVNEVFLDCLDFYQARAEAAPLSPFESGFFRDWIISGDCEKIPFFTYVYHEYGPVRLDGWAKLSKETGELWFWVAARVALWGGILELNYEFSPLEVLDGAMEDVSEHYAQIDSVRREIDPVRIAFVKELARARVGFAQPWLVFGTMQHPLRIDSPRIDLDWTHFNFPPKSEIYGQSGVLTVDQIQHAAWRAPDGRLGFVFLNLRPAHAARIPLTIDLKRYDTDWPSVEVAMITNDLREVIFAGDATGGLEFDVTLESRRVTVIDISPLVG
jgi:hypothetical protein